ncbi:restriction endonuclease subunit S [Arthrobacter koreensis]|uniref:restriction endonuclease subunit S n=1 Tax=Arthrobacter koreensis TaxID=199136 RepID=UPI002DBFE1B7|nr:restriction endonuclease subunit S [Arthrobacter koreensis]MEB7446659.1 restriction endonuclease subunit S [Arthrobacter koreensis]
MTGRKAYADYKDSGVKWLGSIPAGWSVAPIKHVADLRTSNVDKKSYEGEKPVLLCNYTDVYYNDSIRADMDFMPATASESQIAAFTLRAGDTLITKDSETSDDIGLAAYVPESLDEVVCGYHLAVYRPRDVRYGAFIKRFFDSKYAKSLLDVSAQGVTRVGLGQSALKNLLLPVPPVEEAVAIASYLDHETAEIDAFIADQEDLIELLIERRSATITQAVTKGLNLTVPMKDSGSLWLGKVPDAWHVSRLTRYFDVVLGKMLDAGKEKHPDAEMLPYIRAANIQDSGLELSDVNSMPFTAAEAANLSIRSGDLLVVEGGSIGTSYLVPQNMDGWSFQKTVNRVRSKGVSLTSFLQYVLRSYRDAGILGMLCNGSTIAHLTAEKLLNLVIPMPSPQEQGDIVAYLDRETAEIDAAIADAKEAIELSKERRAALISAAVTGKIDVRNHITAELGAA